MKLKLEPHPETPATRIDTVEVSAVRSAPDTLALIFHLAGAIEDILVPPPASAERVDGLWQHTCFEAFIRAGQGETYYEANLSPSTEWAAYRFESYRTGMTPALVDADIALRSYDRELELKATIVGLPADEEWQIGLSAVVEEKDGTKSYWALAHPSGKPDFHHEDCFALQLPPAG